MMYVYLFKGKLKKVNKLLSAVLAVVFTVNIFAMITISSYGMNKDDYVAECSRIIDNAVGYLNSRINDDNSIGDNRTINDTADAMMALRYAQVSAPANSEKWISDNISESNVDMTARLATTSANTSYLASIKDIQNNDGGFGLYKDYSSDVLDSVLVLEALNETGYTESGISAEQICAYLLSSANSDGGFSYNDANGSDVLLSAMTVYNIGRYFKLNNYDTSVLSTSIEYLNSNIQDDYSDTTIEKTAYKYLALSQCGEEFDAEEMLNKLSTAQKDNGSFADSVHVTSLVIRLLKTADYESRIRVTSFETSLSSASGSTTESTAIQAVANIGYISNSDVTLALKFTVYNGKNIVYENSNDIILTESESSFQTQVGEFTLSEPSDEGVYTLTELYDGDKLIKSYRVNIEITDGEKSYSTEISNLALILDAQTAFTGTDFETPVSYELLYATNIEKTVEMKTVVTKDGAEVTSFSEQATLILESNSLKNTPLTFKPDTSVAGIYEIAVICMYEGEEVVRTTAEFNVMDAPVISEPSEDEPAQFEVTWFGPILSEYYVYAGNETEISAGAEINYYSNDVFNGNVKLSVMNGEENVAETSFDISLEKGVPTYFDGKANYPIYKDAEQLTFTVKNSGTYTVYAQLYDAEGNLIAEGNRKLQVVDKPVQDLILNSEVDSETKNMVNLSWNDISNDAESYSYQLHRKTNSEKWEPRSIWNEEETIDVLNVYPLNPYLVDWMNTTISDTELPAGKGIFNIDSVHISSFNSDPYTYLVDENDLWKYDVIFFGSSDCNSGYDLNQVSAEALQKFIDSGRGVLFGHDTICGGSSSTLRHWVFNDFAEQTGLVVATPNPEVWYRTTSVSVVKIGTLTNYPWNIRGDLIVPNTHSTGQYLLDATEWITLNATKRIDEATGAIDNFYLCTKNNIGMIQTGDSTGQASDDERKILANTLFYLYQISQQTTAKDASFYDVDAPDVPTLVSSDNSEGKLLLNVKSKDNGTEYEYYIKATPSTKGEADILSNVEKHKVTSGFAGFVVGINNSSESSPELVKYDENNEFILNIATADENGTAQLSAVPTDFSEPQYVHIFAVDNANNISEEYIVSFSDVQLNTNIETDKKLYSTGDTVEIDTDTLSAPFGRTADMTIEILDEFDNKTAELTSEQGKVLTANENLSSSASWSIPSELKGRYKAVISWKNGKEILAEDEAAFKIADEQSVSNTVSSDKESYTLKEPINLENIVYNNSTAIVENDLMLYVDVCSLSGEKVAEFEYNVSSLNPQDESRYSGAVPAGKIPSGSYIITAYVMQDDSELSRDTAEFTVAGDISSFDGTLTLKDSGNSASADFTVKNTGTENAENVLITVSVFKDETGECVYTFSETASIGAGETVAFSKSFTPDTPVAGNYSGVLKAEYLEKSQDLDYDLLELTVAETTTVSTTSTTTTTTVTTTAKKSDSPKTGVKEIPMYMWAIAVVSLAGIVILRKTGVNENENN